MTLQICCSVGVVCICAEMENSELESIVKLLPDRAREECEELRKIVEFDAWVVGGELLDRALLGCGPRGSQRRAATCRRYRVAATGLPLRGCRYGAAAKGAAAKGAAAKGVAAAKGAAAAKAHRYVPSRARLRAPSTWQAASWIIGPMSTYCTVAGL